MAAPTTQCAPGDSRQAYTCYRQFKSQNRSERCWRCVNATGHEQASIRVPTPGYEEVLIAGGGILAFVVGALLLVCVVGMVLACVDAMADAVADAKTPATQQSYEVAMEKA